MYFPPVMVVVDAGEAEELKAMLQSFGKFKVTNIQPAQDNKAAVFVEFEDVVQSAEMVAMRETLRHTGMIEGRFRIVAQMF